MSVLLRDALAATGLFIEGTENFAFRYPISTYYGFNVTKTDREPIDQIHGFIAAACIEERNKASGLTGTFFPFVAGVFEVLNTVGDTQVGVIVEENRKKELLKKALFERIGEGFDLPTRVLLTHDMWESPQYWNAFAELLDKQGSQFSESALTKDTLTWYKGREDDLKKVNRVGDVAPGLMNIPTHLMRRIGNWPAAILYTPIEVAEAMFMAREKGVSCKIGHMDETVYDKYIMSFMDIVHLRQPTDFRSSRLKPAGVTPYIDKETRDRKIRIYFDDTVRTIAERLSGCTIEEYGFSWSPRFGEVLNPVLDKLVFAVESARLLGRRPVVLGARSYRTGIELVEATVSGTHSIAQLAEALPEVVYENIIAPFRFG